MEEEYHDLMAESENENVGEDGVNNVNILRNDKVGEDGVNAPEVGMMFDDEKEMFEFYKRYAYEVGFPVRKRNSKKGGDGVVRYVTFTCSREGRRSYGTSNSLKQQPTCQTDCKARISDDEARARAVMEWIKVQAKELILTKSSNGAHQNDVISHGSDSQNHFAVNVLDPILSKRKGAPRKLRQRGPLESSSKKVKASSSSGKGKRPRVRHNIADEGVPNVEASQQCSSLTPLSCSQPFLGDKDSQQ